MTNEQGFAELGLNITDICRVPDRGINGKKLDDLGHPVRMSGHKSVDDVCYAVRVVS